MTPLEFQALCDRLQEREHRAFRRAGEIAAAVYNTVRDPHRHLKPFTAVDVFSFLADPESEVDEEAFFTAFFDSMGIPKLEH